MSMVLVLIILVEVINVMVFDLKKQWRTKKNYFKIDIFKNNVNSINIRNSIYSSSIIKTSNKDSVYSSKNNNNYKNIKIIYNNACYINSSN